jgi:hypothetical protein
MDTSNAHRTRADVRWCHARAPRPFVAIPRRAPLPRKRTQRDTFYS